MAACNSQAAGEGARGARVPAAWLVTNEWLRWDKFETQFAQLEGACAGRLALTRVSSDAVHARLGQRDQGGAALPDLALIMDKDVAAAGLLEAYGVRCVNSATAIALCDDKALTHVRLTQCGIAHARTIVAPLRYRPLTRDEWERSDFVAAVDAQLGFPVVLKHAKGSWGSGVFLASSRAELVSLLESAGAEALLAEEFIAESAGHDARVYMVGDEPVAAMQRFGAGGDFRANITGGGRAAPWAPPRAYVDAARATMGALGLEIGAVDFLNPEAARPLVGEVNSNAQFVTLAQTTGVDVAARVADHLCALA